MSKTLFFSQTLTTVMFLTFPTKATAPPLVYTLLPEGVLMQCFFFFFAFVSRLLYFIVSGVTALLSARHACTVIISAEHSRVAVPTVI